MLEELVSQVKSQVLSSLEEGVYQQAVAQNLVDTALSSLVEGAIDKLEVSMPGAAGGLGALAGMLSPLLGQLTQSGLGDQVKELLTKYEVDKALRDKVVAGLTRYLEENAGHLVEVAISALVTKLGKGAG